MLVPVPTVALRSGLNLTVRVLILAIAATALASCRTAGDFGRQKPSYFYDTVVPSVRGVVTKHTGVPHSDFPWTDQEYELRARSQTLIDKEDPSFARYFDKKRADYGFDQASYQEERRVEHSTGTADLNQDKYPRHPSILLSTVTEDIKLLKAFATLAEEVYAADKRRLKALRTGGDVPSADVVNTTGRVKENRGIVENTILALHNRIDDYEIELRRSLLAHPNGDGTGVENAIGRLALRLRKFERRIRTLSDPKGLEHFADLLG